MREILVDSHNCPQVAYNGPGDEPGAIAAPPTSNSDTDGRVLRSTSAFAPLEENYVDVGSPGPGIGDMLVFQDQILDRQGQQVGIEAGTCTITALDTGFQTHCIGTVSLPAGRSPSRLATDAPEKRMGIVGGTGRYRTAAGELTIVELGENEAGTLTIKLAER